MGILYNLVGRSETPNHFIRSVPEFEMSFFEEKREWWNKNRKKCNVKKSDSKKVQQLKQEIKLRNEWNSDPISIGLALF